MRPRAGDGFSVSANRSAKIGAPRMVWVRTTLTVKTVAEQYGWMVKKARAGSRRRGARSRRRDGSRVWFMRHPNYPHDELFLRFYNQKSQPWSHHGVKGRDGVIHAMGEGTFWSGAKGLNRHLWLFHVGYFNAPLR